MPLDSDHRVILAGNTPGAAVILESGMITDATLVGYIEQHCRALIAVAELELHERGELPEAMTELLLELRQEYNDALDDGVSVGEGLVGDGLDGDMDLFARFKVLLREVPRRETTGRPFPKKRGYIILGETPKGGTSIFHRKR